MGPRWNLNQWLVAERAEDKGVSRRLLLREKLVPAACRIPRPGRRFWSSLGQNIDLVFFLCACVLAGEGGCAPIPPTGHVTWYL